LYTTRRLQNVILAKAGTHNTLQKTFAPSHPGRLSKGDDRAMDTQSYVYILSSQRYGTLYIGVTSDLVQRIWQHRQEFVGGFTKQYGVKTLVWYEVHPDIISAITREKQLKKWERKWKIRLTSGANPTWRDLYGDIAKVQMYGSPPSRG
jgi:putative endonuclease